MNIKQIIQNIDKTKPHNILWDITSEFDVNNMFLKEDDNRLQHYYYCYWYCTDSIVGYSVVFLDDIPVAVSQQRGRKFDIEYIWLSKEAYYKTKEYVKSMVNEQDQFEILTDFQEFPDTYSINFAGQLLTEHYNRAIYKDEPVTIIKVEKGIDSCEDLVIIQTKSGQITIELKDLEFTYNLSNQNKNEK